MNRLTTKHRCAGKIEWVDGTAVVTPCGWQPDTSAKAGTDTQIEKHLKSAGHVGFTSTSVIENEGDLT